MPRRSSALLAAQRHRAGDIDVVGFHGQTVLHRPQAQADRPDRRRRGARDAARHPGGVRLPRRRCRRRRAGRAAGAGVSPRLVDTHRAAASGRRAQYRRRRQCHLRRRRARPDRLRHRPGQCADRRFHARAHRRALRRQRRRGGRPASPTSAFIARVLDASVLRGRRRNRSTATPSPSPTSACRNSRSPTARRRCPRSRSRRSRASCRTCRSRRAPGSSPAAARATDADADAGRAARAGDASRPPIAAGWSADALEAQAFAYLAVRCLRGLPITFPTTTGVPRPLTGGVLRPAVADVRQPAVGGSPLQALVEIGADRLHQRLDLAVEEVVGARDRPSAR